LYFSSDEKANVIIGEAAMNLFTAGQEVNVELLINELQVMANSEVNEIRLEKLKCARQWLMGLKPSVRAAMPRQTGFPDRLVKSQPFPPRRMTSSSNTELSAYLPADLFVQVGASGGDIDTKFWYNFHLA